MSHHPQFRCPFCGTLNLPYRIEAISTSGWIVFFGLLIFCFPICWIGLLMKDTHQACSHCRVRLN